MVRTVGNAFYKGAILSKEAKKQLGVLPGPPTVTARAGFTPILQEGTGRSRCISRREEAGSQTPQISRYETVPQGDAENRPERSEAVHRKDQGGEEDGQVQCLPVVPEGILLTQQ